MHGGIPKPGRDPVSDGGAWERSTLDARVPAECGTAALTSVLVGVPLIGASSSPGGVLSPESADSEHAATDPPANAMAAMRLRQSMVGHGCNARTWPILQSQSAPGRARAAGASASFTREASTLPLAHPCERAPARESHGPRPPTMRRGPSDLRRRIQGIRRRSARGPGRVPGHADLMPSTLEARARSRSFVSASSPIAHASCACADERAWIDRSAEDSPQRHFSCLLSSSRAARPKNPARFGCSGVALSRGTLARKGGTQAWLKSARL